MDRFGAVFEHSPWVAEAVYDGLGGRVPGECRELVRRFEEAVMAAGRERQLALLRAHPELAAGSASLTAASRQEQSGAGLDRCTTEDLDEFRRLNTAYREKFGFPFIVAVKGRGRREILELLRRRSGGGADAEFAEALRQVCRIGALRIEAEFHA